MYLQADLPALSSATTAAWTRNIGNVMIKEVELEIGGSRIDKHYGDYLHIWNELTQCAEKEDGYNVMIGNTTSLTTPASSVPAARLYVPLRFWFCDNAGLALPLIALQYHEVKVNFELRPASECYVGSPTGTVALTGASLYVDYIYLDTDERRQFAQVAHEYLIEELQFTGAESFSNSAVKASLNFNHPVKELIWTVQLDSNVDSGANRWTDFTDNGTGPNPYNGGQPNTSGKLLLNGHDRFSERNADYFNLVQPLMMY